MTDGKFTTEATFPDGSPRVLAGMSRRPFTEYQGTGYIHCTCGMILQTFGQGREHWQAGHFDFPIYHTEEPT